MAPWIDIAGWTLLHFIWQGTAIAVVAALGLRFLHAAAPHVRYAVASTALAAMLVAPVTTAMRLSSFGPAVAGPPRSTSSISLALALPSDAATRDEARSPVRTAAGSPLRLDAVLPAIVLLWLAGVVLLQLRLFSGWWRVRGLHRLSLAAIPSAWQTRAESLATQLGVRKLVRVVESAAVDIPSVIGFWRPVILLPIGALSGLTPSQADAILVHELAHIRRHDYLVNGLQHVAETLLFYHPAVWWISRRMRIEREHCCDGVVVETCGDPIDYAVALVELEAGRSSRPALAVAATDGSLVQRIRVMLCAQPTHRRPLADVLLTAFIVAVLVVVTGGGYRWPARAARANLHAAAVQPLAAGADDVVVTVNGGAITEGDRRRHQEASEGRVDVPQPAPTAQRGSDWQVYATDHFEIFFKGSAADARRAEREAERAYRQLSSDLRHDLSTRPNLVLFATGAERDQAAPAAVPGGVAPGAQPRILLALDRPDDRLQADVTHEVTHAFEFDILPAGITNSGPEWIWEGLAEHEGKLWAAGDDDLLRDLIRMNRVPALSAFESGSERRLPYAVGHAAFDFIATRWGLDGIRSMLFSMRQRRAADRGGLYDAAFGISAEAFDQAFEQYLRDRFPSASSASPLRAPERVTLTVPLSYREDQIVFLNDEPISMAELGERLRQRMDAVTRKEVLLSGDGALNLSEVTAIFDILKAAGVDHVAAELRVGR
jgi:beta-lactamase regulating signal transducer with metallopeptidase domain/biopolymer transport protein ExbD